MSRYGQRQQPTGAWRGWTLAGLAALVLTACGGGGGQGVFYTPGGSNTQAADKGSLKLTLPAAGARTASVVPAGAVGITIQMEQVEMASAISVLNPPQPFGKTFALKPDAQSVTLDGLDAGVWQATLTLKDSDGGVLSLRSVHFYVLGQRVTEVPVKLGFRAEGMSLTPKNLGFTAGELIAIDRAGDGGTLTIEGGGTPCTYTLGDTGYLACPAVRGEFSLSSSGQTIATGPIDGQTQNAPPGLGLFRTLLLPGQQADAMVFGDGSFTLSWGDGSTTTTDGGQPVAHHYSAPGYYLVTVFSKGGGDLSGATTSALTQAGVTVRGTNPLGAKLFLRDGQSLKLSALGLNAVDTATAPTLSLDVLDQDVILMIDNAPPGVGIAPVTPGSNDATASVCATATFSPSALFSKSTRFLCVAAGKNAALLEIVSSFLPFPGGLVSAEVGIKVLGTTTLSTDVTTP